MGSTHLQLSSEDARAPVAPAQPLPSAPSGSAVNPHAGIPTVSDLPSLPADSPPQGTLTGFEGPEKLLEIWFSQPQSVPGDVLAGRPSDSPSLHDSGFISGHGSSASQASDDGAVPKHHTTSTVLGLRVVPRKVWEDMLAIVKCQVLNVIHNEHVDAYLLSESSMFVHHHKLILKTCGTTTLLHAVTKILSIAQEFCGYQQVEAFFYSRKNFMFPEKQVWPHGDWNEEVTYLDKVFPSQDFQESKFVMGAKNSDHWCLYVATPAAEATSFPDEASPVSSTPIACPQVVSMLETPDASPRNSGEDVTRPRVVAPSPHHGTTLISSHDGPGARPKGSLARLYSAFHPALDPQGAPLFSIRPHHDVTFEVMMTGLCQVKMKNFWRAVSEQGKDLSGPAQTKCANRLYHATGLGAIYPTSLIDSFVFDPCGFSLNGLYKSYYWTIHVTPEESCSYASFETTIPISPLGDGGVEESRYSTFEELISKVVSCFGAAGVTVTLFTQEDAPGSARGRLSTAAAARLAAPGSPLRSPSPPFTIFKSPPPSPAAGSVGADQVSLTSRRADSVGNADPAACPAGADPSAALVTRNMSGFINRDWMRCQVGEWDLLYGHWVAQPAALVKG